MTAPAVVRVEGDDLLVQPRHGTLPEMKTLGASWDRQRSAWKMAAARVNAEAVRRTLGVEVPDIAARTDVAVTDERLHEYQRVAATILASARHGQILVVPPGLGKTAIAVAAADRTGADQVVAVVPAPLLRTWEREIKKWGVGDTSTAIVHGGEPDWEVVRASRWIVTTWDIVGRHQEWFRGSWPLWVFDESVVAKSRRSQRSMGVRGGSRREKTKADGTVVPGRRWENLRHGIDRVWLLSGSPTTKNDDDLWAQLSLVWPRAFPSYWRFAEWYCVLEENRWSPVGRSVVATRRDRSAVSDNADLIHVVNPDMGLPEYIPEVIDVTLTKKQQRAYRSMTREFVALLDSGQQVDADTRMGQLQKLQQIVSYWDGQSAKHDVVADIVTSADYPGPYLVWTHWREGALALAERLRGLGLAVGHAHGDMSSKKKDEVIESYKAGDLDVLVLNLMVGKFGHTLVGTKTVIYVDKTWNADDYFQSYWRVRRLGLEHQPILVTLRAPGTVDELLELNLSPKMENIEKVTDLDLRQLLVGLGHSAEV